MSNSNILGGKVFGNPKGLVQSKVEKHESPLLTITASSETLWTHGFTASPDEVLWELHCIDTDLSYSAGDIIVGGNIINDANNNRGFSVYKESNGTQLGVHVGTGILIIDKTGSANLLTLTKWKFRFLAKKTTQGDNISPLRTVDVVRLETKVVASGDADVQFNLQQYFNEYEDFVIEGKSIGAATDAQTIDVRTSADGSTFDAGASDYRYQYHRGIDGTSTAGTGLATKGRFGNNGTGTAGQEFLNADLRILGADDPNVYTTLASVELYTRSSAPGSSVGFWSTQRESAAQVLAIQILSSSGNLARGTFTLYGKRKAP